MNLRGRRRHDDALHIHVRIEKGDIVGDVFMSEQRIMLKHKADMAFLYRCIGHIQLIEQYLP